MADDPRRRGLSGHRRTARDRRARLGAVAEGPFTIEAGRIEVETTLIGYARSSRNAAGVVTDQGNGIEDVAHLGGESSKLLFKVLAEWNHALSHTSIASNTPPANGNAPRAKVKLSKSEPVESLSDNIIGVDLSVRRPPRPTDRAPKKRPSDDDGMEVGHG